jgi:thymidylate synthase (FAD)
VSQRPTSPGAEELLGLYFPVLDHGFVALVDYMGTDECIERAARVSYGYGTRKTSQTRGLLRYLRRHLHTTPSEMVELKFHACMPMFIARQWIRHRSACLAGDAELWFDMPGAKLAGRRRRHSVSVEKFHRLWHSGTAHPIVKKKPTFLDRIDRDRHYTISELAKLVERREETLRNSVRDGSLAAIRRPTTDPREPAILVSGQAWYDFAERTHQARVSMRPRLERMKLRSLDEQTGEIIDTTVTDIWETGKKPVFRVTLDNGYTLKMSKDHRCFTERGWLTLEEATELRVGSTGSVSWKQEAPALAVNGQPAYRDSAWLERKRAEGLTVTQIAEAAGTSYHNIRKYLRVFGLGFSAQERARLSGLSQRGRKRRSLTPRRHSAHQLDAIRKARSGPASNFWKGGVTTDRANIGRWTTQVAQRVHVRFGFRCVVCDSKDRLNAHHVDPVWNNPARARDIDNLISLCSPCHAVVHADNLELALLDAVQSRVDLHRFFEDKARQPRPRTKRLPRTTKLTRNFARIVSIELVGEEMTYDLEVAGPYHNFVAGGFVVHNSVNEYSGRYSLMPMLFHTPTAEQLQTQSRANNQGRSGSAVPEATYQEALARWQRIRSESRSAYEWMTGEDVARELARIDLPLSTYTQWYWKIDLHNLLHFLKLRVDRHAQWEIQEYGRVMAGMLKRVAPLSYEAWIDYDVCGARVSRMELDVLRKLVGVDGETLRAKDGVSLAGADLDALGLAKREARELYDKLTSTAVPDFELDLAKARPAEEFATRFAAAVPKVEKPPTE